MQFTGNVKKNASFETHIKKVIQDTTKHLDKYRLSQAVELLYAEFWHWYCDKAIERAKKGEISASQLKSGLETFLKLLHPFMPFVTEQVWQEIGKKDLLISTAWPELEH